MKKTLLLLVICTYLLSGCTTAPRVVSTIEKQAKTFLAKPGLSNLYIYTAEKSHPLKNEINFEITVDDTKVGVLREDTFILLELPAGLHTIHSGVRKGFGFINHEDRIEIETTSNDNFFVKNNFFLGVVNELKMVNEEQGKKDVIALGMTPVPNKIAREFLPVVQQNAVASQNRPTKAPTERLVLMPLRVPDESANLQGAMEGALVQGLQQSYIVFSGEQVAQKAREIFLKESRSTAKKECDETRCMQGIAESFQAELIATANISKLDGGFFMVLSIQNIFDNKVVFSNSFPCKNCDSFQVVEKLKTLSSL